MTLSDLSIRKPVFAWMLMIGLIVFGAISFMGMGISQLPDVDFPVLTVTANWTGAPPETMESAVADVIEDAVMSVEGIKTVTSQCQEGLSTTTIEFEMNANINVALQEVQTKLTQATKILPNNLDAPPTVTKSNPEDQPILWTALTGPSTLREKVLFIRDHLKDNLTTISGVGDVRLGGYVDPNMRIWLSTEKMRKREISVDDVIAAINYGTILTPSGYMDNGPTETNVRILSEAQTPQEFDDLVIPAARGASARSGSRSRSANWATRKRARPTSAGFPVIKENPRSESASSSSADPTRSRWAISSRRRSKRCWSICPRTCISNVVIDTTKFIRDSTHEMLVHAHACGDSDFDRLLSVPGILGFGVQRDSRDPDFADRRVHLSCGARIHDQYVHASRAFAFDRNRRRRRDHGAGEHLPLLRKGMSRVKASIVGAREITGAAVAASLAILAIFLPVVFMKGIIGKFFYQFGVAMSVAVMLSLLEALTLAPMRCSQFLDARQGNQDRALG